MRENQCCKPNKTISKDTTRHTKKRKKGSYYLYTDQLFHIQIQLFLFLIRLNSNEIIISNIQIELNNSFEFFRSIFVKNDYDYFNIY